MKRKVMAVLLASVLSVGLLSGCGGTAGSKDPGAEAAEESGQTADEKESASSGGEEEQADSSALADAAQNTQKSLLEDAGAASNGSGGKDETGPDSAGNSDSPSEEAAPQAGQESDEPADAAPAEPAPEPETGSDQTPASAPEGEEGEIPVGTSLDEVEYVLIYDPLIYDEQDPDQMRKPTSLETGDLSTQIVTGSARADDMMDPAEMPVLVSQGEINKDVDQGEIQWQEDKAIGMDPVYSKGDVHEFYCFATDLSMQSREKASFDCIYEGEKCYVWSYNDALSEEKAEELGKEFDSKIYQEDVDAFGQGRFTENGGKVNILMYPMQPGLGGFFAMADIFSEGELPDQYVEVLRPNYGHAIININSEMVEENIEQVKSTLAHEFQHLICASDIFYSEETPMMRTWLNEAMSAYAEEMVYPGIKEKGKYNQMMYLSDFYRKGQSLYNFATEGDDYIGAYGAVYLFSQYLSQRAGEDVFHKVHEFWRTKAESTMDEAGALVSAAGDEFYQEIDRSTDFPDQVSRSFSNPDEEWMSKLTLAFYLETLSGELAGLEEYEDTMREYSLYSEINPQQIQGGGRMLVQTGNETFAVPENADSGLLYIGLDADFQPIPGKTIVGE